MNGRDLTVREVNDGLLAKNTPTEGQVTAAEIFTKIQSS